MPASPELTTLTALAQALSRSPNLTESLDAALATVAELLGLETGWVWLLDETTGEPRLAAARALPPALRDHPEAMHGDCYCLSSLRAGHLHAAANVSVIRCSRLAALHDDAVGSDPAVASLRCHASIPLVVGSRRLGMLNVVGRDWRVLSEDELHLLTTAGALVSLAVERSRLESAGARAVAAEERNRLAREIHDTLAQQLAALTMQLEVADSLGDERADERAGQRLRGVIARALELSRSTLDEARHSVLELRAAPLEGRTLVEALEALAGEPGVADGPVVDVLVADDEGEAEGAPERAEPLPRSIEAGLYRIAQQALANVARHAQATRAVVRLTRARELVRLRVEDDGIGFDPATVPRGRFGLLGMSERARLLGGSLSIESSPGAGTVVETVVPVRPAESARRGAR